MRTVNDPRARDFLNAFVAMTYRGSSGMGADAARSDGETLWDEYVAPLLVPVTLDALEDDESVKAARACVRRIWRTIGREDPGWTTVEFIEVAELIDGLLQLVGRLSGELRELRGGG